MNENLTSSAVTGSLLGNAMPLRSTHLTLSPSSEAVHDAARLGAKACPGIGFTIASCSAYSTMNGVMIPEVSAGSNQVGASETCEPQISCAPGPAASDAIGAPAARPKAPSANTSRRFMPLLFASGLAPAG